MDRKHIKDDGSYDYAKEVECWSWFKKLYVALRVKIKLFLNIY